MKKTVLAILMVLGMVSVSQAEQLNINGNIKSSQPEACASAKAEAKVQTDKYGQTIAKFGSCDCALIPYSKTEWRCNIDYTIEKKQ